VLVICETAPPQPGGRAFFVGCSPGLAVVARDGIALKPHPMNDGAPPLVESVRCRIPDEPRWFEIGDHRPIVLDIDEAVGE
jgi:hypothetical protein